MKYFRTKKIIKKKPIAEHTDRELLEKSVLSKKLLPTIRQPLRPL